MVLTQSQNENMSKDELIQELTEITLALSMTSIRN